MTKVKRLWRKAVSLTAAAAMVATMVLGGAVGSVSAKAADATVTNTYSFASNSGKVTPVKGQVIDGTVSSTSTGIIYSEESTNNITFDANLLKFRAGCCMLIPLRDDTTKITYTQKVSGDANGRPVYIGTDTPTYKVEAVKKGDSCTIEDITDLIKVVDGKNYIAVYSHGDVKATEIKVAEYNPINRVKVSGKIEGAAENGIAAVTFRQVDTGELTTADIAADGTYSVVLKRISGNTSYIATVAKAGFKLDTTDAANQFKLTGNDPTAEFNGKVVTAEVAYVSGTLIGVPDSALKGELKAAFIPADATLADVELTLTKTADGSYTYAKAPLEPGMSYSVKLVNANDYIVNDTFKAQAGNTEGVEVKAAAKPVYEVKGSFVTADRKTADVKDITFTNMNEEGYTYTFKASSAGYTANLRAGEYLTSATVDGYTVFDHVSVKDAAVSNDVYLDCPADTTPIEYKAELVVGKGKDYETIQDAVDAITRMTREDGQRVTIKLADKLYREQIIINTPNITIIPAEGVTPTISWYYGISYKYYSVAPATAGNGVAGFYSEKYAVDKYEKSAATHWGTAVELREGAKGFKSENVIYESSFNRYMTTEEVVDGVEGIEKPSRIGATNDQVKNSSYKERACSMYIFADDVEYRNCQFLSSQDTLFTGNGEETIYFKNCIIEGTTDFICGNGNPVFDNCTLSIYGYSNATGDGGYITASKAGGSHGYLFYNCTVKNTTYAGIKAGTKRVYFGRPWGAGTKMLAYNTLVESADMIHESGYASMSNVNPSDAFYSEWNTHTADGKQVSTAKRAAGVKMLTDAQAAEVKVTDWFDGWTPEYYGSTTETPDVPTVKPTETEGTKPTETPSATESVKPTETEGTKPTETPTTKPSAGRESVDISNGLLAGVEVNTNSAYGTVSVLEDSVVHVLATDDGIQSVEIDGVTYTQFIQANNAANAGGAVPADGTATYVFKVKKDCSVTLHSKATSKVWWFVESKDQANVTDSHSESYVEYVMTFNLKAGNTYYYYCQGSKPMVYGIYFDEPVAGSGLYVTPTEQPTEPIVKPTETQTQTESVKPTETQTQTESVKPTESQTQTESVKPTESQTQTESVKPTESQTQTESVKPTESQTQTESVKPTESQTQTESETKPAVSSPTDAPTISGDKMEVSGENNAAVNDVVISGEAKFEGNVNKADVKLVIEKIAEAVAETVKSALKGALEAAGVAFDKADAKYYDISLKAGDSAVKLESGKVQITFAWESGKSADKNDVKVYHYNNDKLEEVAAVVTADGIRIVADSFSPYVVVYTEKAAQAPTEAPTQTPGTSAPSTGDTAPFTLYASICVMMLAAGVLVSKKRRAN